MVLRPLRYPADLPPLSRAVGSNQLLYGRISLFWRQRVAVKGLRQRGSEDRNLIRPHQEAQARAGLSATFPKNGVLDDRSVWVIDRPQVLSRIRCNLLMRVHRVLDLRAIR